MALCVIFEEVFDEEAYFRAHYGALKAPRRKQFPFSERCAASDCGHLAEVVSISGGPALWDAMPRKRLSASIVEVKQSKTNSLLQLITVLGGISSAKPIFNVLENFRNYIEFSMTQFYIMLFIVLMFLVIGLLYFLMPEKFKFLFKK